MAMIIALDGESLCTHLHNISFLHQNVLDRLFSPEHSGGLSGRHQDGFFFSDEWNFHPPRMPN